MSERDPFAPIIEGFDCSGITDPFSLRCEPFFVDGENGGTLLDGSTVHDVLASKVRLSWALNVMTPAQYAALNAATQGAESLDTVRAYVYDPTVDALRLANFHVTRPACRTIRNMGQAFAIPQSELVLEEASPIARFAVTPPAKTAYEYGDALDLTGLSVTQCDPDGAASDITAECMFDPPDGATLTTWGAVTVGVSWDGVELARFPVFVNTYDVIASGDWWALYENGLLTITLQGATPSYSHSFSVSHPPWYDYRDAVTSAFLSDGVTKIGADLFYSHGNLMGVRIPDGVTEIGGGAFYHCAALKSVDIPAGVTAIGGSAFEGCSSLHSIAIPDGVGIIQSRTFCEAGRISKITLPVSVTAIRSKAFYFTTSGVISKDIYYGGSEAQWGSVTVASDAFTPSTSLAIHYNSANSAGLT